LSILDALSRSAARADRSCLLKRCEQKQAALARRLPDRVSK